MEFWWYMFGCSLLVPVLMIIGGWRMWKHCPEKPSRIRGYRSRRSRQSPEAWKFANAYCGHTWWELGWALVLISALAQIRLLRYDEATIGGQAGVLVALQLILLLLSAVPTELALRKKFEEE